MGGEADIKNKKISIMKKSVLTGISVAVLLSGAGFVRGEAPAPALWAFDPPLDTFSDKAVIDLRSLNEKVAGESGFVKVDANGDFLLGNGKPVRFWAINTSVGREQPFVKKPLGPKEAPQLDMHARFLAKRGVNMVRLLYQISPKLGPGVKLTDINEQERDGIWRVVAAMKKEGIYTTIEPYWAHALKINPEWNSGWEHNHALLFFDEKLQAAHKTWIKALYAEKNPYTGIPLAKDPAVAIIQIQNEDSFLFWTINALRGEPRKVLGRKFAGWAVKKYGSLDAALKHWDDLRLPGDDVAGGVLDFINIWQMTTKGMAEAKGNPRHDDQVQFWAESMLAFNKNIADYMRNELGCKQLINAGNWKTADNAHLNDVERWSYTGNDVLGVNRYYSGLHLGKNRGWAVENGDLFTSPSVLKDPLPLPINLKQAKGFPMIVSESSWVMPAEYATEGPFLIAAYSSLTGVDCFYWFSTGDERWSPPQSANGYNRGQQKWVCCNPDMLGMFPAAALLFRNGFVKRGEPVVHEERSLEDLWKRRTAMITELDGWDPNRDRGESASDASVKNSVPPLAFLAGPVEVVYGGDPAKSRTVDLTKLIDEKARIIRSNTGELNLDYGKNLCTLNAPKAQGVTGFFGKQNSVQLADVDIKCTNDYATILAVSLDGKPLRNSGKILVQVGTKCRPTDWRQSPTKIKLEGREIDGFRVDDFGKAPWQVVKAQAEITVRNAVLKKAVVLDVNFEAIGEAKLTRKGDAVQFTFPEKTLYVVLE